MLGDWNVKNCVNFKFYLNINYVNSKFYYWNSTDYMVEKLGIDKSKINELSNLLYKHYGTTMAGLRVSYFIYLFIFLISNQNYIT